MTQIIGFPLELKAAPSSEGIITGYASTFGNVDLHGDVIERGAFAASIGTAKPLLWSHDQGEVIGKTLELTEDAAGLKFSAKLSLGVKRAAEAFELAKDAALSVSIGFITLDREYRGDVRVLKAVDLREISLVAIPANPNATITEAKQLERKAYSFLRESGYSRKQASIIVPKLMPILEVEQHDADLLAAITDFATFITRN